jgi:hypothetical protein
MGTVAVAAIALIVGWVTRRPVRPQAPTDETSSGERTPTAAPLPEWVYVVMSVGVTITLIVLPRELAGRVLLLLLAVAGLLLVWPVQRRLRRVRAGYLARTQAPPTTGLVHVPAWLVALELTVVIAGTLYPTAHYWQPDPTTQLDGIEAQWLTSSAHVATATWVDHGYIPLWNPYNERGEPLLDNPFSFVLNPISTGPSLLLRDSEQGIKTSVAAYAVVAALGGWFLGRVLNLSTFGRLLLAAMLCGKGNMVAMITDGYFQLGTSQAYMPWILGAALGLIRLPRARWPLVVLAVSFTLLFWAGNIWYTLPMLLSVGALWLFWDYRGTPGRWRTLRRFVLAAALTVGLSAISLFPIFANRAFIGGHKPLADAGETVPTRLVLSQFVQPNGDLFRLDGLPDQFLPKFYYSYTTNRWWLLALFVLVPPFYPLTGRPRFAGSRRLWWVGLFFIVFFVAWGVGGLQPFRWAYNTLPGIGRWRFVGRALGAASFWLALLVALRADGLLTALLNRDGQPYALPRWARLLGAVALLTGGGRAAYQSTTIWDIWGGTDDADIPIETCVGWLRAGQPDGPLAVYRLDYREVLAMYRQRVRVMPIEADYYAIPREIGEGPPLYQQALPRYGLPKSQQDTTFLIVENAYRRVGGSPLAERLPCVARLDTALPFAFSAWISLVRATDIANNGQSTPLPILDYRPGFVMLEVVPLAANTSVAVVQEVAYPGWRAWVNGERAEITPVGGFLAVTLPPTPDAAPVTVQFAYRPRGFLLGGLLTLVTAAGMAVYLLRKPTT